MKWALVVLCASRVAWADDRAPALDDFYERGRTRLAGFGEDAWLVHAIAGVETANPSADEARPVFAYGVQLGGEVGYRAEHDVVRTRLVADVLRVSSTGQWLANAAWQALAFADLDAVQLSADNVLAQKDELEPSDVALLQHVPYRVVDSEVEAAAIGPRIDKDTHLAVPVGVANRVTWSDDDSLRRTSVSAAVAARGYAKDVQTHAQLDFLRAKYTEWTGGTRAWTLSAGYQRLPEGIDTLPLWALVGYEWAGDRAGVVAQIGMDLPIALGDAVGDGGPRSLDIPSRGSFGTLRISPAFERHFDVDPMTLAVARVTSAKLGVSHAISIVRYGATYEAAAVEDGAHYQAITPSVALTWRGLELGFGYRITLIAHDNAPVPTMPAAALPQNRFVASVAQKF